MALEIDEHMEFVVSHPGNGCAVVVLHDVAESVRQRLGQPAVGGVVVPAVAVRKECHVASELGFERQVAPSKTLRRRNRVLWTRKLIGRHALLAVLGTVHDCRVPAKATGDREQQQVKRLQRAWCRRPGSDLVFCDQGAHRRPRFLPVCPAARCLSISPSVCEDPDPALSPLRLVFADAGLLKRHLRPSVSLSLAGTQFHQLAVDDAESFVVERFGEQSVPKLLTDDCKVCDRHDCCVRLSRGSVPLDGSLVQGNRFVAISVLMMQGSEVEEGSGRFGIVRKSGLIRLGRLHHVAHALEDNAALIVCASPKSPVPKRPIRASHSVDARGAEADEVVQAADHVLRLLHVFQGLAVVQPSEGNVLRHGLEHMPKVLGRLRLVPQAREASAHIVEGVAVELHGLPAPRRGLLLLQCRGQRRLCDAVGCQRLLQFSQAEEKEGRVEGVSRRPRMRSGQLLECVDGHGEAALLEGCIGQRVQPLLLRRWRRQALGAHATERQDHAQAEEECSGHHYACSGCN
eukprot:scaffold876_cov243-Pinguiococcus_pyrenoidosus.AAC.16